MNLRNTLFAYAVLLMAPGIALPDGGCCNNRTSPATHQKPAPNTPTSKRPPDAASTIKRTKIERAGDQLRSQLSLQFQALVPEAGFAYFKFVNHSSEIISLPGPALHQPPGRLVYLTSHERFLVQKGKDWKPLYGGHWGASRDFDVSPGSEITLLVPLRDTLGSPLNERVVKVGFGKIYSQAFRYNTINDEFLNASKPSANPPAALSNLKRIRADDVDDETCSRLHLRYDTLIPYSRDALFTFENSSPHIILLDGWFERPPGKVYYIECYRFLLQQGDGWKDTYFGGDGLKFEFDVHPGSKVVLIITLRHVLGHPNPNKVWKIRLGNIYSEPFRYALPK